MRMGLARYAFKRILLMAPTVFLLLIFIFFVVDVIPGDAAMVAAGLEQNPIIYQALREDMGLDQPVHIRFFHWMARIFQGNLGKSLLTHEPVTKILSRAFPITASLAILSFILAFRGVHN